MPIRPSSMRTSPNSAPTRLRARWCSNSSRERISPSDWTTTRASVWKYPAKDSPRSRISGTETKLDDYGGIYSSVKAEKYVELNGVTSDSWVENNKAKLYAYGKRTYEWFRDNPTYDNGERVMFIGTINYE